MPTVSNQISFRAGTLAQYKAKTPDENAIYFLTDTKQLFVGASEYSKSVKALAATPTEATAGDDGTLYYYNGNLYLCNITETAGTFKWTRVSNVNDTEGTITSVTVGEGLAQPDGETNPITAAGTIKHAIPEGAAAHADTTSDQTPALAGTFEIESIATDKFGHVIAIKKTNVTLPAETVLSTTPKTGTATTIDNGGKFSVVTGVAKGTGSHELEVETTEFTVPTGTTYTLSTGDAEGTVKVTPSIGEAYEVTVKDWDKLAKLTDITSVFKFKGSVATRDDLPTADNIVGDVYFVTADSSEYVWAGTTPTWEELGPVIDLSGFATKTELTEGLALKVDKTTTVNGHALSGNIALDKTDVGLDKVDNTADADKVVASAGKLTTAVDVAITGAVTGATAAPVDGSTAITIATTAVDPTKISAGTAAIDVTGNAGTATALAAAKDFSITGAATAAAVSFDGSDAVALNVTELDASKLTGEASVNTTGNAATATKATQDAAGNVIATTYATKQELTDAALVWNEI